jgi:radical SAM/Cys-rich protein
MKLIKSRIKILQINVGRVCNQICNHCYADASPYRNESMNQTTLFDCIKFLESSNIESVEITGGTPELNTNFEELIECIHELKKRIIVRCNLTVLHEAGKEHLPDFYKRNGVDLYCSLPCYTKENVDMQRGEGIFEKSINALRMLNKVGYGKNPSLILNLIHNPIGAFLPRSEKELKEDYRNVLFENYNVSFNNVISLVNMPINRFRRWLKAHGEYDDYMNLLYENFNPSTVNGLMCKYYLNVGWDGKIYDCEFNQFLGITIRDPHAEKPLTINGINEKKFEDIKINTGTHCYGCTAGRGSSCMGELVKVN